MEKEKRSVAIDMDRISSGSIIMVVAIIMFCYAAILAGNKNEVSMRWRELNKKIPEDRIGTQVAKTIAFSAIVPLMVSYLCFCDKEIIGAAFLTGGLAFAVVFDYCVDFFILQDRDVDLLKALNRSQDIGHTSKQNNVKKQRQLYRKKEQL